MVTPFNLATLLYCFNARDQVLLLERAQEPNRGLWSPCGGKIEMGESPYAGACREAAEELGISLHPQDLHLTGMVNEYGYMGQAHWLMFLFEVKPRIEALPPSHREGQFRFFDLSELATLKIPRSDREQLWPLFWQHRGGFFAAHCTCHADGRDEWIVEESVSVLGGGKSLASHA